MKTHRHTNRAKQNKPMDDVRFISMKHVVSSMAQIASGQTRLYSAEFALNFVPT